MNGHLVVQARRSFSRRSATPEPTPDDAPTNGAIKDHLLTRHNSNLTRDNILCNTVIIRKHCDTIRLLIHDALLIKYKDPNLNRQDTGNTRILQLYFENFPEQNSN